MQLAQLNGKPAEVNYADIDYEIARHKQALTAHILKTNPTLQQYVRDNPLAAEVSQDDWGQLDSLSGKLKAFTRNDLSVLLDVLKASAKGFEEFHGTQYPLAGIYGTPKGIFGPMQKGETYIDRALMGLLVYAPEEFMRIIAGGTGALAGAAGEWLTQAGIAPERSKEDIAEFLMDPGAQMTLSSTGPWGAMAATALAPITKAGRLARSMRVLAEQMEARGPVGAGQELEAIQAIQKAKPWLDGGEVPPVGVDPAYDALWKERAKQQQEKFEEAQKAVSQAETTAKVPKYVENLIESHDSGKDTVGIPAWVIRQLYGDKPSTPDDGMLGWIPNFDAKLRFAERHNGDVQVPVGKLMTTRAENPEFSQAIKDHIRIDHDGMTPFEAKELKKGPEEKPEVVWERPPEEEEKKIVPPEAAEAPGRYSIKEIPLDEMAETAANAKAFDIMDGDKEVGTGIAHIEGDTLVIDRIAAHGSAKAGRFGPQVLRDLWESIADQYPEINKIAGYRVSGARTVAGEGPAQTLVSVRRSAGLEPTPEAPTGWEIAGGVAGRSLIHPDALVRVDTGLSVAGVGKVTPDFTMSLSDALSMIDPEAVGPEGSSQRILHDFYVNRIDRLVGDTPVHVMPAEWMNKFGESRGKPKGSTSYGFYDHGTNAIYLHPESVFEHEGYYGAGALVHEGAHALTSIGLERFPELRDIAQLMMKEARAWWEVNDPEALNKSMVKYAFKNEHEFVAQSFSFGDVRDQLQKMPASPELMDLARNIGWEIPEKPTLWDLFKGFLKAALEKITGTKIQPTILHALFEFEQRMEEIRAEAPEHFTSEGAKTYTDIAKEQVREAPPKEEVPRVGIEGKARFEKWYNAIVREAEAKKDFNLAQGLKIAKEQESAEWKARLADVTKEVRERLINRPDLMLDEAMRTGRMGGRKLEGSIRLAGDLLTAEEKKGIPDYYFSSRGYSADDLAEPFGFKTGEQLLQSLRELEKQRSLEDLTPQAHFSKMVEAEADRQMRERYGSLEDRVLEAAKDHVHGPAVMDRLAEDIHALGLRVGEKAAFDDAALKAQEREDLQKMQISELKSKSFRKAAERNGTIAQDSLLVGKNTEALKAKQMQFANLYVEGLVAKLEKRIEATQNRIGRLSKREVSGISQQRLLYIHQLISHIGEAIPRSPAQQAEALAKAGIEGMNLREYVEHENTFHNIYNQDPNAAPVLDSVNVWDRLLDPPPPGTNRTGLMNMTVEEFNATADSIESLEKYSKRMSKIEKGGQQLDTEKVIEGLNERLKASMDNKPLGTSATEKSRPLRTIGSLLLTPESWFNRLDLGNKRGPFSQLITRPILEGQYYLRTLERKYSKMWGELGEYPDYNRKIQNPFFRDADGLLVDMTKANAYAVLQNMGNALQRKKTLLGWGVAKNEVELGTAEHMVWNWLATPIEQGGAGMVAEDLARAKKMGDIFGKAFDESSLNYVTRGVLPDKIDLGHVPTPWGMQKEWYHPLVPDPSRSGAIKIQDVTAEGGGYFRPSPAHGYTQQRTGAIYRVDLNMNSAGYKLKQILNDTAMRPAIQDVSKIVYNKDFKEAFIKYYGKDYFSALDKWMHDVAGNRQWNPSNQSKFERFLTEANRNLTNVFIGFNWATVAKHFPTALGQSINEVGMRSMLKTAARFAYDLPGAREAMQFAYDSSEELQNRMRMVSETITGVDQKLFPKPGSTASLRDKIEYLGHFPIAYSDYIVSNATWVSDYRDMAKLHPEWEHGDLVDHANTAVRRTHGSTILANRPQVLRYHPVVNAMVPLYNFFSSVLQRNYEAAWMAKIAFQGGRDLPEMQGFAAEKFKGGPAVAAKVAGRIFWSGLMVAAWEEMVDPLHESAEDYQPTDLARIVAYPYASMVPGLRDTVGSWLHGRDTRFGGLYAAISQDARRVVRDAVAWDQIERNPGKFLRSANRLFGAVTGLNFDKPTGPALEYMTNVMAGKESPNGMGDLFKGLRTGSQEERRHR